MAHERVCSLRLSNNISDFVELKKFHQNYNIAVVRLVSVLDEVDINIKDLGKRPSDKDTLTCVIQDSSNCITKLMKMSSADGLDCSVKDTYVSMQRFLMRANFVLKALSNFKSTPESTYLQLFESFFELCGLAYLPRENGESFDILSADLNPATEYYLVSHNSVGSALQPVGILSYTKEMFSSKRLLQQGSAEKLHKREVSTLKRDILTDKLKNRNKETCALPFVPRDKDRNMCASVTDQSHCNQTDTSAATSKSGNSDAQGQSVAKTYGTFCPLRKRTIEGRIKQPAVKLPHANGIVNKIPIIITLAPEVNDEDENTTSEKNEEERPSPSIPRIVHPSFKAPCYKLDIPTVQLSAGVRSAMEQEFAFPTPDINIDHSKLPYPIIISTPSASDAKRAKLSSGSMEFNVQGKSEGQQTCEETHISQTEAMVETRVNFNEQDSVLHDIESRQGANDSYLNNNGGYTNTNDNSKSLRRSNSQNSHISHNKLKLKCASSVVRKYKRDNRQFRGKTPRKDLVDIATAKISKCGGSNANTGYINNINVRKPACKKYQRKKKIILPPDRPACQRSHKKHGKTDKIRVTHGGDSRVEVHVVRMSSASSSTSDFLIDLPEESSFSYQAKNITATTENSLYNSKFYSSVLKQDGKTINKPKLTSRSLDVTHHQMTVNWLIEQQLNDLGEPGEIDLDSDVCSVVAAQSSENSFSNEKKKSNLYNDQEPTDENFNASSQDYKPPSEFIKRLKDEFERDKSSQCRIGFLLHKTYVVVVGLNQENRHDNDSDGSYITYSPVLNIMCKNDRKFLCAILLRLAY